MLYNLTNVKYVRKVLQKPCQRAVRHRGKAVVKATLQKLIGAI